jgi:hypothetical protein
MDATKLLHRPYSASTLGEPAPSPGAVRALLESAAHVPDHGQLLSWRLVVVVVGFIHVGTDTGAPKTRPPRSPEEFARHLTGTVPA